MSQPNPYVPPSAALQTPLAASEIATQGRRFANFLLDSVGYLVLSGLVGFVLGFLEAAGVIAATAILDGAGELVFGLGLHVVYYAGFEGAFGRTPAKFLTRTRVVAEDGGPAGFGKVLGRTLVRMVPFEPFSFLGSPHPVGWHDRWSGTRVVRDVRRPSG